MTGLQFYDVAVVDITALDRAIAKYGKSDYAAYLRGLADEPLPPD